MHKHIALITYLVRDYDEAITWFQTVLGFKLYDDSDMGSGKRWVVIGPEVAMGARFLLAKAVDEAQFSQTGRAAGGRVAYFLHTDDFTRDEKNMKMHGVRFHEAPRHEAYGIVAVFEDLYGNRWDLLQPNT